MSMTSTDVYLNGILFNGYDYTRQAWVVSGRYIACGHSETMNCRCFGRLNEGLSSQQSFEADLKAWANGAPSAPFHTSAQPSIQIDNPRGCVSVDGLVSE